MYIYTCVVFVSTRNPRETCMRIHHFTYAYMYLCVCGVVFVGTRNLRQKST